MAPSPRPPVPSSSIPCTPRLNSTIPCPSDRITLLGRSFSGILLRLFLADGPFEGRLYSGRRLADTLVMLGYPHTALKATAMRARVARTKAATRRRVFTS